jgi:hypothetical protein
MQQSASSKQQRTPEEEHPQSAAAHSDEGLREEALEQRYLQDASPSGGFVGVGFERFLKEPAAVVVGLVWVVVLVWLSMLVLTLYMFGTQLASMAAGV